MNNYQSIKTVGELKKAGYTNKSIKEELRDNLIASLRNGKNPFDGIIGYEDSVIPDLQTAILSRHNIVLLGLRGQAKTKIARMLVNLLDEYIPVIDGTDLNDDPLKPLSKAAKDLIDEHGDDTGIRWMHKSERYTEKLATPDVSVADLIGDVDPIKAAALKLPYSDERVIHFGLIPRSHRCIFVINELPDLQARIQVALFNILQESDIQIRGFKVRLPLDIQFVFTANPEDYTNRGSIVTPLKDRIDSQILTHYPKSIEASRNITSQEAELAVEQQKNIFCPDIMKDLIEQIAFEARSSEYIDNKSGVSARLTISSYENLFSAAERRAIINNEDKTTVRISDLYGVIPAITGKIELVYEGEQEGPSTVAQIIIGKAIKSMFENYFPSPDKIKKTQEANLYQNIINWFNKGNELDILNQLPQKDYKNTLNKVPGLQQVVSQFHKNISEAEKYFLMEFLLHGLAEYSMLSKFRLERGIQFKDMFSSMFTLSQKEKDESNEEDYY